MNRLSKLTLKLGLIVAAILLAVPAALPARAADYDNTNMIDDGTFNDVNSMGSVVATVGGWPAATQPAANYAAVTNFLSGADGKLSAPSACLAGYSAQNWFYDGTTFHYGSDPDWNLAWGPTGVSAAQIIYTASHMWGINPQVMLATLQKEQSLVTGTSCTTGRYNAALGYGCPDSGGCNAKYAGFTKQVLWAGFQFEFNMQRSEGNLSWYGNDSLTYVGYFSNGVAQNLPYKRCASCATLSSAYSTPATIDGQTISIANGATASLFTYTPHLNQSFPGIFESWFGSVRFHGSDPVGSFDVVGQLPGTVRVAGWGLDRSMTGPATIHVYIDGVWAGAVLADTSRSDVGAVYPTLGNNHGFDGTVPYTTAGTHQVCAWVVGDNVGAANFGLGCKSLTINNDPMGSFDVASVAPGVVHLAGWGFDRSLAGSANIHVYIDGVWAGYIVANNARPDVASVYPSMGPLHGFDGTVPYTTAGIHQVCAWVVGDANGAPNAGLGCKAVLVNNDPLGSLDIVNSVSGGVHLGGWGFDRSLAGPANIHVYIDGVWAGVIAADTLRSDVGAVYPAMGDLHGFDGTLPYTTAGKHQACAWVVGDSLGASNFGLACKTFTK